MLGVDRFRDGARAGDHVIPEDAVTQRGADHFVNEGGAGHAGSRARRGSARPRAVAGGRGCQREREVPTLQCSIGRNRISLMTARSDSVSSRGPTASMRVARARPSGRSPRHHHHEREGLRAEVNVHAERPNLSCSPFASRSVPRASETSYVSMTPSAGRLGSPGTSPKIHEHARSRSPASLVSHRNPTVRFRVRFSRRSTT
jgi:hypothetical protein